MGIHTAVYSAIVALALAQTSLALPMAPGHHSIATSLVFAPSGSVRHAGVPFSTGAAGKPQPSSVAIPKEHLKSKRPEAALSTQIEERALPKSTITKSIASVSLSGAHHHHSPHPTGSGGRPHPTGTGGHPHPAGTGVHHHPSGSGGLPKASGSGHKQSGAHKKPTETKAAKSTVTPAIQERALPPGFGCVKKHQSSMPASISSIFADLASGSALPTTLPSGFPTSCFPSGIPTSLPSGKPSGAPAGKPASAP